MTPELFKEKQAEIGWTNRRLAQYLDKTEQSVSNWRMGRQGIPPYVGTMLETAREIAVAERVQRAPTEQPCDEENASAVV